MSQRPIAVHALENLGRTDTGIGMLRQTLRHGIAALARGTAPPPPPTHDGVLTTFAHDTVLHLPARGNDDEGLLTRVCDIVTEITLGTAGLPHTTRRAECITRLKAAGLC